jgi:hypothetical protein
MVWAGTRRDGFSIHPAWDSFGSETLYLKVLYANYPKHYAIIEFIGEWNDAINNDIMLLKRNFIELLLAEGISKFVLIGESVFNFHGSDDSYYEEWLEDVDDKQGWISCINMPEQTQYDFRRAKLDRYIAMIDQPDWRIFKPFHLFKLVSALIQQRLNP